MACTEAIRGNWSKVRGQIGRRWTQLRDGDNLDQFRDNVDALVGEIQRKTGESREVIEDYLEHVSSQGTSAAGRMGQAAKQYAFWAAGAAAAAPGRVAEGARGGYAVAERLVRQRPRQTLLGVFGLGLLVAGLVLLLLRRWR